MKLTDELKNKLEKVQTKEEAKAVFEEAGFILSEEEIESISGGKDGSFDWKKAEKETNWIW